MTQHEKTVKIIADVCDTVNFAMQQNHVPIVRQITISNNSDENLVNLNVSVTTDPDIADEWSVNISEVSAGEDYKLDNIKLNLSATRLFELTESVSGTLAIEVSDEAGVIAVYKHDISFLSYDEWSGAYTYPEFLAAFVTPNHPYIFEILKNAETLLAEWTGSPSFTGYQSNNHNNVLKQMAAIYGALQQENITYCAPPASFEKTGQKVRLCSAIKEQKLATCLDLSLLYAGCLEAVGLNPMIIMVKGHAFVACWLEDESFAECIQDDISVLTKRIAPGVNEICVVESTAFVKGAKENFENAVAMAENHLKNPEDFLYLIGIKRSRGSGIKPLPLKREDGSYDYGDGANIKPSVTDKPDEIEVLGKLQYVDTIEYTRQQMWERKLLDLSMRNSLLNFRVTKNSVQLLADSLYELEDALSDGKEFQIFNKPADMTDSPRDNKIYETVNRESPWVTLIKSEFKNNRIRTYLDEFTLSKQIQTLYRTAKTSMEENGANTMYLALGFLKWYENNVSEKPRYAPLVLLPVDIIRKSAQRGYVFRLRDEEPQFNVTLLEMLRADFGIAATGLDPLPYDENGVDIKTVFHTVRQLIMSQSRWDVEELAFIGVFSFTQFIMWNDIRNRVEDLKKNKIVSSLIAGQMNWTADAKFPLPDELDDNISPADMAVPISADSSQLAAIYTAGKSQSFVLHGPPGTGKSQTITNIIANALYQGKSVLFVAEKMAALEVVQKRLESIGVGNFCLELHSNKARKKDVLEQLDKALNIGRIKHPDVFYEEANSIFSLRKELNAVVRKLHKPRTIGFSLYDAVSKTIEYSSAPDGLNFSAEWINALTPQKFSRCIDLCRLLSVAVNECHGVHNHSLREYKNAQYRPTLKLEIESSLQNYRAVIHDLATTAEGLSKQVGLPINTFKQYSDFAALCSVLSETGRVPSTLLTHRDLPEYAEKISSVCASGKRRDAIKTELCQNFSEKLFNIDAALSLFYWEQADKLWFLPKTTKQSKIYKEVKLYAINKKAFSKKDTVRILSLVAEYRKNSNIVAENATLFNSLFGILFDSGNCDWAQLETVTTTAVGILRSIRTIAHTTAIQDSAIECIAGIWDRNSGQFKEKNKTDMLNIKAQTAQIAERENTLSAQFLCSFDQWHSEQNWANAMTEKIDRWLVGLDGLRDYCTYLQVKADLNAEGIEVVCDGLENGLISCSEIEVAFIKNASKQYVYSTIDAEPTLSQFRGNLFSHKIEKFKELCNQYQALTRQELAARLSAEIPVVSAGVSGSSEVGMLQRAIKSGGRMMSVRKLFESIPNLLRKLSPCMLMSPISVAQYLDPKYPPFDLVIFDEASQMPTSEAVGAIARGKELIVVGDPMQLPPTSFFSSNHIDEANYDKEDLESVLDDCLAISMPQEHLLWHYRSRHESLIAFSNQMYYDNKLYTFPSPNDMSSQVRLIPVEGFYDKGKTKQNQAEAEAIVKEIMRRLSDPVLQRRSMGVVTFNSIQQNLITDMLEEEFSKHPNLDELANNSAEPIFVKNLENVQGDERDVILFSIGYGPDSQGRVTLNFGPLNREGGWRRLNVAVSRARYEMLVYSVLKPEQIDLNRTRAEGLVGLKAFLEFAARGSSIVANKANKTESGGVVSAIADGICKLGFSVKTGIGVSGYQVDIGIINPEKPDEYILGVLCDSENYFRGGTALDRNQTQESVLNHLGWNLIRVWTLDWLESPQKELTRIKEAIEDAIARKADEASADTIEANVTSSANADTDHAPIFETISENTSSASLKKYTPAVLPLVQEAYGDSEYFLQYKSTAAIKSQIEEILSKEAPISHELLCKRVLSAWGISRRGARINKRLDEVISLLNINKTMSGEIAFYWRDDTDPHTYDEFRVPSNDEASRRNMEDIVPEEIASAVKHIVKQQFGLAIEDLQREVAKIFGFARCTANMTIFVQMGIKLAVDKNWIILNGGRVSV